jgi:hypothetical protein
LHYTKRLLPFLLLGALLPVLGPHIAFTQGPGGRQGRRPGAIFDRYSGGKEAFDVNTVEIPEAMLRPGETAEGRRDQWRAFLQRHGVTDNKMTRELFRAYASEVSGQGGQKQGGNAPKRAPGPTPFDRYSGGKEAFDVNTVEIPEAMLRPGETAEGRREQWRAFLEGRGVSDNKMTRELFRAYVATVTGQRRPGNGGDRGSDFYFDRYSSGAESFDVNTVEIPPPMLRDGQSEETKRNPWRAFLKRKGVTNGLMTRELFREFYAQATRGRGGSNQAVVTPPAPPKEEAKDKRPVVFRVGKLPKGLPPWFEQLDTDRDGQVGLYEWKAGGRSIQDFLAMDLNGDGFVTVEEALRFQKAQKKLPGATAVSRTGGK